MRFTREEIRRMRDGELLDIGERRYALCRNCWQIVRVDKPVLGSLHLCAPAGRPPRKRRGRR